MGCTSVSQSAGGVPHEPVTSVMTNRSTGRGGAWLLFAKKNDGDRDVKIRRLRGSPSTRFLVPIWRPPCVCVVHRNMSDTCRRGNKRWRGARWSLCRSAGLQDVSGSGRADWVLEFMGQRSVWRSILPSLVNKTLRNLNSSTWGGISSPTQ